LMNVSMFLRMVVYAKSRSAAMSVNDQKFLSSIIYTLSQKKRGS